MTCFWDGILKTLNNNDFNLVVPNMKKIRNINFVVFLKNKNIKTNNVKWNGQNLTQKQLEENFEHIKVFNPNTIGGGYLCSTCEPFLFLVAELFKVNINHNYMGHVMQYRIDNARKTLNFRSNKGHFVAK